MDALSLECLVGELQSQLGVRTHQRDVNAALHYPVCAGRAQFLIFHRSSEPNHACSGVLARSNSCRNIFEYHAIRSRIAERVSSFDVGLGVWLTVHDIS